MSSITLRLIAKEHLNPLMNLFNLQYICNAKANCLSAQISNWKILAKFSSFQHDFSVTSLNIRPVKFSSQIFAKLLKFPRK